MIALAQQFKAYLLALVLPPVPMLLLALGGAVLLHRQRRRSGWTLMGVALLALWLSGTEGAGQWLARHLVHTPPPLDARALDSLRGRSDVAVLVLGGGARSHMPEYLGAGGPSPVTLHRLRYGVWLARQLDAPLGFTGGIGWAASKRLKESEASIMQRVAREEFGLPLRWAESESRDTRENASRSIPLLKADGVRRLVIVTHDMHMPRALRAFTRAAEGQGIEIIAAPLDMREDAMSELRDWLPDSEGYTRVGYAVYEWLGYQLGR